MLKWILGIMMGLVWCGLVFLLALWLTFPSQAIVDRVAYEVQTRSDGAVAVRAGGASPWGVGLSLTDVEVFTVDPRTGKASRALQAEGVSASTGLFAWMNSEVPIHGVISLAGEDIVVDALLNRENSGAMRLQEIEAVAPALDVEAVGALLAAYGVALTGTGDLDVDLDLEVGRSVGDHDGRLSLRGKGLTATLAMPDPLGGSDPFELGPMTISDLDIVLDVKDGKATLKKGTLRSDLANLTAEGMLTLNEDLMRSRLRGELSVGSLGGQLATFEPFMRQAQGDDGDYHYRLACMLSRFDQRCIRPKRQAASGLDRARVNPARPSTAVDPSEAAARRAERRRARAERLAERRARIAEERANRDRTPERPRRPEDDEEEYPEDEDEEYLDEEDDPEFDPQEMAPELAPELGRPPGVEIDMANPPVARPIDDF